MRPTTHKLTNYETMYLEKINISKKIIGLIGRPVNSTAVSAMLETLGYHEKDMIYKYGYKNIFEFSEAIYYICLELNDSKKEKDNTQTKKKFDRKYKKTSKYFYGIIYIIPVLGQIVALFSLRYSLWISLDFNEMQATVVVFGTILSFIVTGGFIQVFSKEGIFQVNHENFYEINDSATSIYTIASIFTLLIGLILYFTNMIFNFFDPKMIIISLLYYVSLSFLWLHIAILFNIKHYLTGIILPLLGIIPVHLIMIHTHWGIYTAHLIGLLSTNILALSYCYFILKSVRKHKYSNFRIDTSPFLELKYCIYKNFKYFLSGLAFYIFFCTDRLISWSVHNSATNPYFFWFKTEYELGLVWAFLPLLFIISFLESLIQRFSALISKAQKIFTFKEIEEHNRFFMIYYVKHLCLIVILGLAFIIFFYLLFVKLKQLENIIEIQDFFRSPITYFTFYIASISYLLLAIGLYNGLIFFTLARPQFVIKALIPAIVINILTGLFFSRWISYEYGIIGLAFGAITYAFLSTKNGWSLLKKIDYYYYAGF
jgi:hypothetical protein